MLLHAEEAGVLPHHREGLRQRLAQRLLVEETLLTDLGGEVRPVHAIDETQDRLSRGRELLQSRDKALQGEADVPRRRIHVLEEALIGRHFPSFGARTPPEHSLRQSEELAGSTPRSVERALQLPQTVPTDRLERVLVRHGGCGEA